MEAFTVLCARTGLTRWFPMWRCRGSTDSISRARIRADKRLAELPVVLVTALESRNERERGIDVGAGRLHHQERL